MSESFHVPSALNYIVKQKAFKIGQALLVYNKTKKSMSVHLRLSSDVLSSNNRGSILRELGFAWENDCHFFNRQGCFSKEIASAPPEALQSDSILDRWSDYQHRIFEKFCNDLDQILDLSIKLRDLIPKGFVHVEPVVYSFEVDDKLLQGATKPGWIEPWMPKDQRDLFDRILSDIKVLQDDYVLFGDLLHETGHALETAVLRFFCFLGLESNKTLPGSPTDIKAVGDGFNFAVEVTGITKAVGHKDGKVAQSFIYSADKSDDEKIVLVANTFRNIAPSDRPEPAFSEQTLKLMTPHEVCLVTTVTLYKMWTKVLGGEMEKAEVLKSLKQTIGVLNV